MLSDIRTPTKKCVWGLSEGAVKGASWEVSQATEKTVDGWMVNGDLPISIYKSAGKGIIAAILHTDMVKHNEMIKAREFTVTSGKLN